MKGKIYLKEDELQSDVNNFLEKTDFFGGDKTAGKCSKMVDGFILHQSLDCQIIPFFMEILHFTLD